MVAIDKRYLNAIKAGVKLINGSMNEVAKEAGISNYNTVRRVLDREWHNQKVIDCALKKATENILKLYPMSKEARKLAKALGIEIG